MSNTWYNSNVFFHFKFHACAVSKRYQDLIEQIASPNRDRVVRSIEHATLSCNARPRYVIGFDAKTIWMAIATLPTTIGDWIGSVLAPPIKPGKEIRKNL